MRSTLFSPVAGLRLNDGRVVYESKLSSSQSASESLLAGYIIYTKIIYNFWSFCQILEHFQANSKRNNSGIAFGIYYLHRRTNILGESLVCEVNRIWTLEGNPTWFEGKWENTAQISFQASFLLDNEGRRWILLLVISNDY